MRLRELFEAPQKRTAVVAFGRMNPPTIGHQKLVEALKSHNGDHYVFLSQSQKPKTDPLPFTDKLRYAKFFFPEITIGHPDIRTPMDMMVMLQNLGYTDIIYVAGSDRVEGFKKLFNDYNGKPDKSGKIGYTFDSIEVVSAGERDPDADGAEGMSASKMRQAAADGDLESFTNGVPRPEVAEEMFAAVRQGMGIKDEQPEIAEAANAGPEKIDPLPVPQFPEMPQQDGDLGDGAIARKTKLGMTLSNAEGTFLWDASGKPAQWRSPAMGGITQTHDLKTGTITVRYNNGGLKVTKRFDKNGNSLDAGDAQYGFGDVNMTKNADGSQNELYTAGIYKLEISKDAQGNEKETYWKYNSRTDRVEVDASEVPADIIANLNQTRNSGKTTQASRG